MKFLIITNDPGLCLMAADSGVHYVFVDLETKGKELRQGHTSSFISTHSFEDVCSIRPYIRDSQLLVRINPLGKDSAVEIERVIEMGADVIMLPMFQKLDEVQYVSCQIAGRVEFWPLVETLEACRSIASARISDLYGVDCFYFGLNDLHLELGLNFMFSSLTNAEVRNCMARCGALGFEFGFGGISTLDSGQLSGRHVLGLHKALGSSRVILSRSFCSEVTRGISSFEHEFAAIRDFSERLDRQAFEASSLAKEAWRLIEEIESTDARLSPG